MPSTNKTSLGLNKWLGTDKPQREDFNRDNDLINNALINKADKNRALQQNLYAQYAYTLKNPTVAIDSVAIFDNPPINQMSQLDYQVSNYYKSSGAKPANAPPTKTGEAYWWQILTFCNSPGRALQIATQCFTGENNGRMFLRTRHLDNSDYSTWQAWREVATCACDDAEWKLLPLLDGWGNMSSDSHTFLKYRKGAGGDVVYVNGVVKFNADSITATNRQFALLPAGYRPSVNHRWFVCSMIDSKEVCTCRVGPSGILYVSSDPTLSLPIAKKGIALNAVIPI